MTAHDAAARWQALHTAWPRAAQLALRSCLPVWVSPALLRLARLRLMPQAGTGDEADLCLSELVESRSSVGFSYRRAVREHLRAELAQDAALLDAVWQQVHQAQAAWLTPRARLEEELTWRLLRDRSDPEIERHWQTVLQTLDVGPDAEGLARWVMRAVPDLPEGALDSPAAQRAWQGAHLMLGDAGVLGEAAQTFLASSDFAFATRRLPRRRVQVGLLADGGVISPLQTIENGHAIDVPATRPLWLQLEDDAGTPMQVLTLPAGEPVQWTTDHTATVIRAIDGAAYRLGPPPARAVPHQKVARNRVPRVQIEYRVELYGSEKKVELPFVIGVMADLSGRPHEPLPDIAERKFLEIDLDNFDDRMKGLRPRVAFQVPDVLTGEGNLRVDLEFERLDDFLPMAVLQRLEPLRLLLEASENLANLPRYLDRRPEARELLARALGEPDGLIGARTQRALKHDVERERSKIHHRLNEQVNVVLHHDEFRKIETAWRGLHYLVRHTETNETLKIRVLNMGKTELAQALQANVNTARSQNEGEVRTESLLFKKVFEEEYGQLGGEPYGLLVGDYLFDHTPPDVEVLQAMARLAAAAHAPFLAGVSPALLQMNSWQELGEPRDIVKMFASPEYLEWRTLRESDDARFVGLAMPGFLARAPYFPGKSPVEGLEFQETFSADSLGEDQVWANAAYAMAANIGRAFSQYGWCARIRGTESGGLVDGLPTRAGPEDLRNLGPVEAEITDRREADLSRLGLMPLVQRKQMGMAVFYSANSLHQPAEHEEDPDAIAAAGRAATWPYLLVCTRFLHYLRCMVRDKVGGFSQDEQIVRYLIDWLMNYVDESPETSSDEKKARHPLAAVEVTPQTPSEATGYLTVRIFLRPQYQLEGMDRPLELVARLPSHRSA